MLIFRLYAFVEEKEKAGLLASISVIVPSPIYSNEKITELIDVKVCTTTCHAVELVLFYILLVYCFIFKLIC